MRIESSELLANRYVFAGIGTTLLMMSAIVWMPSYLGILHDAFGLEPVTLSRLAFTELAGFLAGTLFAGQKSIRQLQRWIVVGCVLLMASNIGLAAAPFVMLFFPLRALAGFGAGIGFGYGFKVCNASAKPTRNFGLFTGSISLVMIFGFQGVAFAIDAYGKRANVIDGDAMRMLASVAWLTLAALAAVAAALFLANRAVVQAKPAVSHALVTGRNSMLQPLVLVGLAAIALPYAGQGGVWAFLQIMGVSDGFPVAHVALAMSGFAIMGVVGGLVAAAVPSSVPRSVLLGFGLLILWVGLYALYAPASWLWYVAGCGLCNFYWSFVLPLVLGMLAHMDPTGRAAVMGGAMSSAGSAMGPLLAGPLIDGANYRPVGWLVALLCTVGFLCVIVMEKGGRSTLAVPGVPAPEA